MSSHVCTSCKNYLSCTYPRNQVIVQCEEYEYAEPVKVDRSPARPDTARTSAQEPQVTRA